MSAFQTEEVNLKSVGLWPLRVQIPPSAHYPLANLSTSPQILESDRSNPRSKEGNSEGCKMWRILVEIY